MSTKSQDTLRPLANFMPILPSQKADGGGHMLVVLLTDGNKFQVKAGYVVVSPMEDRSAGIDWVAENGVPFTYQNALTWWPGLEEKDYVSLLR